MAKIHRLKHNFTAGELSPLMDARIDLGRYNNGCKTMLNFICLSQGPATNRPGTEFLWDITPLGVDVADPQFKLVPFIFNETQAYALVFFKMASGIVRCVFFTQDGYILRDGNTDIVALDMPAGFGVEEFTYAQSSDELYVAQTGLSPHIIVRNSHTSWSVSAIPSANLPTDWSGVNGWPELVSFHQQRLVYGNNLLKPTTVWMSKSGDFYNFLSSGDSPIPPDDPIAVPLASGTQNKLNWMQSSKAFQIGTLGDEWTVTGSTTNAIAPTNVLALRQTNNGSDRLHPLMVGLTTLFVERHGRTVNEFVYDLSYDSYKNSDISILAPHLTELYGITDWSYQQTPNGIVWCIREDGDMIGLTYQRQHKVVGWHHHHTDGEYLKTATIPGNIREDIVFVLVHRVIDDVDKYYMERFSPQFYSDKAIDGRFMDSWITNLPGNASTLKQTGTILSGLDHLEGKEISLLADGTVHPPRTVENGQVTLNNTYTEVLAGLPYVSELRPNLADVPSEGGTSIGRMQRTTHVDIQFHNTLGGFIGKTDSEDGDSEEEIIYRVPGDPTGSAVPMFSGIKHLTFMGGFDREVEYFIRQKQPLPMTVVSVVDSVEVQE